MGVSGNNLYYVALYNGHAGIVAAYDLSAARQEAYWFMGGDNVQFVRPATHEDIDRIKAEGGRVPRGRVLNNTRGDK